MKEKIIELGQVDPPMTLREIAAVVGCSGEYVRQVLKHAGVEKKRKTWRHAAFETHPALDFKITPLTVGATSELLVAVDLMKKGFSVFRALAGNAACDLICFKGSSKTIKIEVRSGNLNAKGNVQYSAPLEKRYDCLAVCLPDTRVIYRPEISELL